MNKQCSFCGKLEIKILNCKICKTALYCSKECHQEDSENHKLVCNKGNKNESTKTLKAFNFLTKNNSFMTMMFEICKLYWSNRKLITYIVIETGLFEFKGSMGSFPHDNKDVSKIHYNFAIHCALDNQDTLSTTNSLCIAIPKNFQVEKSIFGKLKPTLPVDFILSHDKLTIIDYNKTALVV